MTRAQKSMILTFREVNKTLTLTGACASRGTIGSQSGEKRITSVFTRGAGGLSAKSQITSRMSECTLRSDLSPASSAAPLLHSQAL